MRWQLVVPQTKDKAQGATSFEGVLVVVVVERGRSGRQGAGSPEARGWCLSSKAKVALMMIGSTLGAGNS